MTIERSHEQMLRGSLFYKVGLEASRMCASLGGVLHADWRSSSQGPPIRVSAASPLIRGF